MVRMRRANGGFSLIELIVVISIIAVLTGLLVPSIAGKYNTEAKTCAYKMNDLIGRSRVRQMSGAGDCSVTFEKKADGLYATSKVDGVDMTPEKLASGVVSMSATEGGAGITTPVTIKFDRATGKLDTDSGVTTSLDPSGSGYYTLYVSAGMKTYSIEIVALTGRHTVSG